MPSKLPPTPQKFREEFPEVWQAFARLGDECHKAGTLDERTRRLVKLALAIGAGTEGGTHSAVRNALADGITSDEIKHVVVLAITTLGFPEAMRAFTWIGDYLSARDDDTESEKH